MGDEPRRIVAGLMLATAALSARLSNTATTLMLLSIGVGLLGRVGMLGPRLGSPQSTRR